MSKINSVTIVGGGSSGWMTAAAFSKMFPRLKITLVESKNVPIIGVGESSLATINHYLEMIELKDEEWMPSADATYKTAIKFTNFLSESSSYYDVLKPETSSIENVSPVDFFLISKLYPDIDITDFSKYFDDTHEMIIQNKLTDRNDVLNWNFKYDKAYHMDAYKFGLTLKEKIALPNGVVHIEDDVVECTTNNRGEIDSIITKNNGALKSDLYIDCTGFKAILIEKTLGVPFESFSDKLINDRAIATNIPYVDKEKELNSWTNCTTLKNGWLWNIPVWDRIGAGYVFSSKFVDDETALKEFKEGLRITYGDRADNIEPKFISFTPGVRKKPWYKNVLSIGLTSGFLEPLRSTGLMVTHNNIMRAISLLSIKDCFINTIDKELFNNQSKQEIYNWRDFVIAHYAFCRRKDSEYWKYVTEEIDYLEDSTEFKNLSTDLDLHSNQLSFNIRILTGMGYNPLSDLKIQQLTDRNQINYDFLKHVVQEWKNRNIVISNHTRTLPSNLEFLKQKIYKDH